MSHLSGLEGGLGTPHGHGKAWWPWCGSTKWWYISEYQLYSVLHRGSQEGVSFLGQPPRTACPWNTLVMIILVGTAQTPTLNAVSVHFWKSGQLKGKDGVCFLRLSSVSRATSHLLIFIFVYVFPFFSVNACLRILLYTVLCLHHCKYLWFLFWTVVWLSVKPQITTFWLSQVFWAS